MFDTQHNKTIDDQFEEVFQMNYPSEEHEDLFLSTDEEFEEIYKETFSVDVDDESCLVTDVIIIEKDE